MNREFLARDDVYNVCKGGSYERDNAKLEASSYRKGSARRHDAAMKCKKTFDKMKLSGKFEDFRKHVSDGVKRHKKLHPYWMAKENNPMHGKTHSASTKEKMSR